MDNHTIADELEGLITAATKGDLATAELHTASEMVECPLCGDGEIEAANYCNFDDIALGVQFYGIGNEFGAHEKLWRWFTEHRETILAALRAPAPAPMGGDVAGLVERLRENDREIFLPLLGEAADMLERLTQPPADAAVAMEQWQPIETAPRDGSKFLVWEEYYGIRIGRCKERADHDDWLSYMDAFGGSSKGGSRATHWMPLLAPPAAIRAGGQP